MSYMWSNNKKDICIMKHIKIKHLEDDVYQVWILNEDTDEYDTCVFQGNLSDCEAFINLKEKGYM